MSVHLRVESITVIVLALCLSLSFYFAFLSLQVVDDALKKQLVTLAASTLITGVVIFAVLTIHLGIKRAFKVQRSEQEQR